MTFCNVLCSIKVKPCWLVRRKKENTVVFKIEVYVAVLKFQIKWSFRLHVVDKLAAHTDRNPPLMFHDEADGVLYVPVLRRAASLHLRLFWMSLMLDVLERMLHQIPHRSVLGRVQSLNVLQNIQHLRQRQSHQTHCLHFAPIQFI